MDRRYSVRKLKGINEKNLCEFNDFSGFFLSGVNLMDGNIAFNSYVMSPVSENLSDDAVFIEIINLFFDRVTLCLKVLEGRFKDASTASYHYGWRLFKPENLLKVFVEGLYRIREGFMGVRLRWLRIVFKHFNICKSGSILKSLYGFFEMFVAIKGCLKESKDRITTVWAFQKGMCLNKLYGFTANVSFSGDFIRVKAGYRKACIFVAIGASNLNSIHRRCLCI